VLSVSVSMSVTLSMCADGFRAVGLMDERRLHLSTVFREQS
jgi:hypothetical protein